MGICQLGPSNICKQNPFVIHFITVVYRDLQDSMQMDGIAVDESQRKKISSDQTGLLVCLYPPKWLCIAVRYSAAMAAALVVMYAIALVASNNVQWVQTDDEDACFFRVPSYANNGSIVSLDPCDGSFTLGSGAMVKGLNNSSFRGFRYRIINLDQCAGQRFILLVTLVRDPDDPWGDVVLTHISNSTSFDHRTSSSSFQVDGVLEGGTLTEATDRVVYNGLSIPMTTFMGGIASHGANSSLEVYVQGDCDVEMHVQFWPLCEQDACVQGECSCQSSDYTQNPDGFCTNCTVEPSGVASCRV